MYRIILEHLSRQEFNHLNDIRPIIAYDSMSFDEPFFSFKNSGPSAKRVFAEKTKYFDPNPEASILERNKGYNIGFDLDITPGDHEIKLFFRDWDGNQYQQIYKLTVRGVKIDDHGYEVLDVIRPVLISEELIEQSDIKI